MIFYVAQNLGRDWSTLIDPIRCDLQAKTEVIYKVTVWQLNNDIPVPST